MESGELGAELVDLALAREWLGRASTEAEFFAEDEPTLEESARDVVFAAEYDLLAAKPPAAWDAFGDMADDEEGGDETGLSEQLVEWRVVGGEWWVVSGGW